MLSPLIQLGLSPLFVSTIILDDINADNSGNLLSVIGDRQSIALASKSTNTTASLPLACSTLSSSLKKSSQSSSFIFGDI